MGGRSYEAVMARKSEIVKAAVGIDYSKFEEAGGRFDYERMKIGRAHV